MSLYTKIKKGFLRSVTQSGMCLSSSSWIFIGEKGIGKAKCALDLAKIILSHGSKAYSLIDDEQYARLESIENFHHPDLYVLETDGMSKTESISVDSIRALSSFLSMTASKKNGIKIAIVDCADSMTINAFNALLKVLEEPTNALIILIAHSINTIPVTIRSRCQKMKFSALDFTDFIAVFKELISDIPTEELEALYKISNGRIGFAKTLYESNGMNLFRDIENVMVKGQISSVQNLLKHFEDENQDWDLLKHIVNHITCASLKSLVLNNEEADHRLNVMKSIKKTMYIAKMLYQAQEHHLDKKTVLRSLLHKL